MTSLERTYELISPAAGGRDEKRGEVSVVVSRLSAATAEQGDVLSLGESYVACVRREAAPEGGFARGMRLVRGKKEYTVESALESSRLWILRLSRTLMDGEV